MYQKIEKNQDGSYQTLSLRCGILPYFFDINNQIVWGCIKSNRLGLITITPAAGVQDLLISNERERIVLEVGKPLPDLEHEALREFIGRHLRDEVYQKVLTYFESRGYVILAENPLQTAFHETEEEHGIDLMTGGHDSHLLREFTVIQDSFKSRSTIKLWLAELKNSDGVVLKHTDKIESKIRRNQGKAFFEEGCWGTVQEFQSSLNQQSYTLNQSDLFQYGLEDCQNTIDLLILLEKRIRNKKALLSGTVFSTTFLSESLNKEQNTEIRYMH